MLGETSEGDCSKINVDFYKMNELLLLLTVLVYLNCLFIYFHNTAKSEQAYWIKVLTAFRVPAIFCDI